MKPILSYPHTAERIFNAPLMIAQAKMDAILAAVQAGLELPANAGLPEAALPEAALPGAALVGDRKQKRVADVTPEGIAIVPVTGTLVRRQYGMSAWSGLRSYMDIQEEVLDAATDPGVKGILLEIDSPGGEAGGLPDLMDVLEEARELKPIWAAASEDAFSAAYGIASMAERIYVTRTGGVGSVGVIAVHLDHSEWDKEQGLTYTIFRGGRFKAEHNSHEKLTDHATTTLQAEIDRLYGLFAGGVAQGRGMSTEAVMATEANLYFGENALEVGFADAVGTLEEAHEALVEHIRSQQQSLMGLHEESVRGTAALHPSLKEASMKAENEEQTAATAQAAVDECSTEHQEPVAEQSQAPAPDTQVLDLEKEAEKRGKDQALAYAKEVRQLCRLAGKPELADEFIEAETSTDAVRVALLDQAANEDEADRIVAGHDAPIGGTGGVDMHEVQQDAYARLEKAGAAQG